MALRPAVDRDWEAVTGMRAPAEWFGYVDGSQWLVEGLGAVYLGADERWWLSFWRCPGVRKTKTAHAGAVRLIRDAKDKGLTLYAMADPSISGSSFWIERLGFRRSEEERMGIPVWTL